MTSRDGIADMGSNSSSEWDRLRREVLAAQECLEKLVSEAQDAILVLDGTKTISFANTAARRLFHAPHEDLTGAPFGHPVIAGEVAELDIPRQDGKICTVEMRTSNTEWKGEPARLIILRDVTGRKRAEMALRMAYDELEKRVEERTAQLAESNRQLKQGLIEREKLISKLSDALSKVKLLSGFLPICAGCKKIRDDKGYWRQIEQYIRDHSEAEFSHSLCPECVKRLYPKFYKEKYENS